MQLSLGISPCPNDTFIFDWLINHWPHRNLLTASFHDVQQLNELVIKGELDVAKISYATLPSVLDDYIALRAGGAMGEGVGPLLIGKQAPPSDWETLVVEVMKTKVALPGKNTTANLLFDYAFPKSALKTFAVFNKIEQFVQDDLGLGVIIHENRFTYQQHGLHKWLDLGDYWQEKENLPIPLGVIVIKKCLVNQYAELLNEAICESLAHAWKEYPLLSYFVKMHASEMEETTMRNHVKLYVNSYSKDVGPKGSMAVRQLLNVPEAQKLFYNE